MNFDDDFQLAARAASGLYGLANRIATAHDLSIRRRQRPKRTLCPDDWRPVLELDGDETEYRVGFSIHLSSHYSQPGTARIWSLVTDLRTGKWFQDTRENVPLAELELAGAEVLLKFEGWLKSNEGLDPIEQARQRAGTAYYWSFGNDDGYCTNSTDFAGSGWTGEVSGADDDFEATMSDPLGKEVFRKEGEDADELILTVEAEYARLRATPA